MRRPGSEIGNKAGEAGQAHGGHCGDYEGPGRKGEALGQVHGFEFGQLPCVGALIDDAPDNGEEQAGDDSVGEHLITAPVTPIWLSVTRPSSTKPMWLTLE